MQRGPVPSERAAGVPDGGGSRVCFMQILKQPVDDLERWPPRAAGRCAARPVSWWPGTAALASPPWCPVPCAAHTQPPAQGRP